MDLHGRRRTEANSIEFSLRPIRHPGSLVSSAIPHIPQAAERVCDARTELEAETPRSRPQPRAGSVSYSVANDLQAPFAA